MCSSDLNSVLDPAGMPGSNTGNLPQTLVSLARKLLCVPTRSYTLESMTLSDTDDVNALVLRENGIDGDLLLEVLPGEVDLVSDASTVQLNLHDVSLLLPPVKNLHLCVHNNPDDSAVLLHLVKVLGDLLLAEVIGPLGARLGERLLLGLGPVLVESTLGLLTDMLSPDGLQSPKTTGGLDVSNNTNATMGGVSMMVHPSTTSFLLTLDPGLSTSRTM